MVNEEIEEVVADSVAVFDGVYGWGYEVLALILFVLLFNFLIKWLLKRVHQRFKQQGKKWQDIFIQALYKPLSVFVWFFAILHVVDLIHQRFTTIPFFGNVHQITEVGLVVCIAWFLMRWKNHAVRHAYAKAKAPEKSKLDVMDKAGTVAIILLTVLFLLELTDRSLNTLIAFGGISGLAIAFASQQIIANFFGGLMIYTTQPFTIGDWINLPEKNVEGIVEEIGWYMTLVRDFEKRPIYIPNSIFSTVFVMTPSRMTHRKIDETITLRYEDFGSLEKIMADIKKELSQHSAFESSDPAQVFLSSFGSYSVNVDVQVYTDVTGSNEYNLLKEEVLFILLSKNTAPKSRTQLPTSNYPGKIMVLKVFIGAGNKLWLPGEVLRSSIARHTKADVRFNDLSYMPPYYNLDPNSARALHRFAVPQACGYEGKALYIDAECIVLDDIAALFALDMKDFSVLARPIGEDAGFYTGVMLMDCSKLKEWDVKQWAPMFQIHPNLLRYTLLGLPGGLNHNYFGKLPDEWHQIDQCTGPTKILRFANPETLPWKGNGNPCGHLFLKELKLGVDEGDIPRDAVQREIDCGNVYPELLKDI